MASQERFGYEWSKYNKIIPEYELQFLKWVFPFNKNDFKNKALLDAGCGIGRNSYFPLKYGAKKVVAFDYSKKTVSVAKKNLSEFKNAKVEFSSIMDIKYKDEFDIAISIGVFDHLDNPAGALINLKNSVRKRGSVLIWVQGFEGNEKFIRLVDIIRPVTCKLPLKMADFVSFILTAPLFFFLKIFPTNHPYFRQISKMKFWHLQSIILDQIIPEVSVYWKEADLRKLMESSGLKNIKLYRVNNNSWTAIGTK